MADTLRRKYGPLPLWAWLAVAGAAVTGVVLYLRQRAASSSSNEGPALANMTVQPVGPPDSGFIGVPGLQDVIGNLDETGYGLVPTNSSGGLVTGGNPAPVQPVIRPLPNIPLNGGKTPVPID